MTHKMKLNHAPFCSIKFGRKTVEMRLYDEKRSLIKIGDEIEFSHRENGEKVLTRVCNLTKFKNFDELYKHYDKIALGYDDGEIADPYHMSQYYSNEDILRYGVLAIEIKLI